MADDFTDDAEYEDTDFDDYEDGDFDEDEILWEYKVITVTFNSFDDDESIEDQLDELGSEGWELCSIKWFTQTAPYFIKAVFKHSYFPDYSD
jgi:hypothetical protein